MKVVHTPIPGAFILEPKVFKDHRGFFFESYNQQVFEQKTGLKVNFIQDNHSKSSYGVLRGLHYQISPHSQSKLIRATEGVIQDVIVDIRKGSPTYGKHISVILSSENKRQLFIPKGFAHGFLVLSEYAALQYKCDYPYRPEADRSIAYMDPAIGIDWQIPQQDIILSEKDQNALLLKDAQNNFTFV